MLVDSSFDLDDELITDCERFVHDPYGWVLWAFDWGNGDLQNWDGPDVWQAEYLRDLGQAIRERAFNTKDPVAPVRMAVGSGHGIGKSALVSWLVLYLMSTRPNLKGTITATTNGQLKSKTFSEIAKWHRRCIVRHWFHVGTASGQLNIHHIGYKDTWRMDGQSCEESNSEAFAGQHEAQSSSVYIFDEASGVPDKIWEVTEGGLTDGEPFWLAFGNRTKNTGRFHDCFNRFRHRWDTRCIDSRTAKTTNKAEIQKWIDDHGIDSDFARVRILGLAPNSSTMQFFDNADIRQAMERDVRPHLSDPVVMGVDVARFGGDASVIWVRRGHDCRSIPRKKLYKTDTMTLTAEVAQMARDHRVDVIFVDEGGVGGGVVDRLQNLGYPVWGINFGLVTKSHVDDYFCWNRRAEIYVRARSALRHCSLPDEPELKDEMAAIDYRFHKDQKHLLIQDKDEIRKTLGCSPDDTDAFALLWAVPLHAKDSVSEYSDDDEDGGAWHHERGAAGY